MVFDAHTANALGGTTDPQEAAEWKREITKGEWGEVCVFVTKGDKTLKRECYSYPKEKS